VVTDSLPAAPVRCSAGFGPGVGLVREQLPDRLEAPAARPADIHLAGVEGERRLDDHPDPDPAAPRTEVVGLPRRRVLDHTIPDPECNAHPEVLRGRTTKLTCRRG
jgi:hypothetical protein